MFIDTHVHLNNQNLYQKLDQVIKEALDVGVNKMIVVGYNKETSLKALEIANNYSFIYASVGFHPTEVFNLTETDFEWLEQIALHPKVVAIGECGYDFHWQTTSKKQQELAFIRQIDIAKKINKPLIIHSREAMELTFKTLTNELANLVGGVMHSYSGSVQMLSDFIKLGFYIGIGGPVTFLNAKTPKEVVKAIDLSYLLSETDAPYLTPHPYRGKENAPCNLPIIVKEMAQIKGITIEKMANIINNNAYKLFNI